ncbi:MAG: RrF2 family transcriptional regulator [Bacteroidota bacterium]
MFQLSKKVEYALMALRHMTAGGKGKIFTTKDISQKNNIPYDLLAKIMQVLARKGFIASHQGVHGGYTLLQDPSMVKVSSIIEAIEGRSSVKILQCEATTPENCTIHENCTIKDPLMKLQGDINQIFETITIMQLL